MKQLSTLLIILVTIPVLSQTINEVTINSSEFEYKTAKNESVKVYLEYSTTEKGEDISNKDLIRLINLSTNIIKVELKSSISFIPFSYKVKYKYNKKGKHKYSVQVQYSAQNSYGAEVDELTIIEFNRKFKETFGSVMLRVS